MDIRTFVSASVIAMAVCTATAVDQPAAQEPQASGYAWAGACRSCHQEIYDAWATTKHANALDRLTSVQQEQTCVGCHVTGPKQRVMDGRTVLNRGVQCEACHGAAAAHAANTAITPGLVKTPPSSTCEACHSDKGPHFKGFFYAGMAAFSHKVR